MSDGLSKLAALMGTDASAPTPLGQAPEGVDPKLFEDMNKVLAFAAQIAGDNLFDQQMVIEECAMWLREQIREEVEGG